MGRYAETEKEEHGVVDRQIKCSLKYNILHSGNKKKNRDSLVNFFFVENTHNNGLLIERRFLYQNPQNSNIQFFGKI